MTAWTTVSLCIATAIVTQLAFTQPHIKQRLLFRPQSILADKERDRLFTSAFIHADWMHAGFNLFALFSFGSTLEIFYGWKTFLFIYAFSVLGGSLLSLYLHRLHDYAALGASGGVCGIIFASIFLVPGTGINMFFIPIAIPGNLFAIVYLLGTFWALRKGKGNVGHDAHFGGASIGLALAFTLRPNLCLGDPLYFWSSIFIVAACLIILFIDPLNLSGKVLPIQVNFTSKSKRFTGDQRYDGMIADRLEQAEIDYILEKISTRGIDSLSVHERDVLERRARRNRER